MDNMTTFFREMLNSIAAFLAADPVIYIFGLVCLCMIVKVFKEIISLKENEKWKAL